MSKFIIFLISVLSVLMFAACGSDDKHPRGKKPRRDSNSGTIPWAKPSDWEGGLPGMGGVGSQNNNY